MITALFVGFAALALVSALLVVLHRSPVTSALFLVLAFCSLAAIYLLLRAEFLAMVQIIVYAGAIMVLFLFVIMYLNLGRDVESGVQVMLRRSAGWLAGALVVATAAALFTRPWAAGPAGIPPAAGVGNTQAVGLALYSRYLFPFEITSLVLLVAMVGAVVIARGRRASSDALPVPAPAPRADEPPASPGGGQARAAAPQEDA